MNRLFVVGLVAIVGALSLGAAAAISVDGGNVGSGTSAALGGYTTSATSYTTDGNGDVIGVDFTITPTAGSVDIQTNGLLVPSAASDSFANWECTSGTAIACTLVIGGSPVAAGGLTTLTVVASS